MSKDRELKVISRKIQEHKDQLEALTKFRNDIIIEIFKRDTGFNVGDNVIFKGKRAIIFDICIRYEKAIPVIRVYKKDGSVSKLDKQIYSWDIKYLKTNEK